MKSKLFLFLVICSLCSCANKNILVKNQVSTQYVSDGQDDIWSGKDARKKINVESLRVLVADKTGTTDVHLYEMPFQLKI